MSTDSVRLMSVSSVLHNDDLETLRFTFSYDIVEHLYQLRANDDDLKLSKTSIYDLRLFFSRFDEKLPAVFVRLAPGMIHPGDAGNGTYPKLTKDVRGHTFTAQIRAERLGVSKGVITQKLETLWLTDPRHPKGLVLIFNEDDMLFEVTRSDVASVLRDEHKLEVR